MQPINEIPTTIMPEVANNSVGVIRADDRTRHHKKVMLITALGFITLLIALGLVAWYVRSVQLKNQALANQYQQQSFERATQEAQAFFATNPQSKDPKAVAAAQVATQKTATTFFKKNTPVAQTPAEIAAQAAYLKTLQQQGFTDWKAAQAK